jgi:hypothetical protein
LEKKRNCFFEGFDVVIGKDTFGSVWSRSMLFKVIKEDIDTAMMNNGFENSDTFERKFHEFVNKYSEVKVDFVKAEQRRIMIRNRIINEEEWKK